MSFQAMTWATATTCGSATTKLVLLMLANHANGHTGQCNPRHKTLASECEIRVETLKDHLKRLADAGLIEILPQFMDGVQLPNQYRLNMHMGGGEFRPGGGGEFRPGGGGEFRPGGGGEFRPPNNQEVNQEVNQHPPTPKGERSPVGFEEFWKAWPASPRKVGKKQCSDKWERKKFGAITEEILVHVMAMKTTKQWRDGFEPAPLTYLNGERWKDGLPSEAPSSNAFAGVI